MDAAVRRRDGRWYTIGMKGIGDNEAHRAATVPDMIVEEELLLSEEERTDMVVALKEAEARIAAGEYVEHDPDTLVDRLTEVRASAIELPGAS
jgi:hypothetical protein